MNYIKGAAIKTMSAIIKTHFKKDGYIKWINSLSNNSLKIYSNSINTKEWYSLDAGLLEPTLNYCALFYNWDLNGAWELGRFSADFSLKGIYKMFIKMGSPQFLIKKASVMLPSYYKKSSIRVLGLNNNSVSFEIYNFPQLNKFIEYRIAGWMERAFEISGCKEVNVKIVKCSTENDLTTKIMAEWK